MRFAVGRRIHLLSSHPNHSTAGDRCAALLLPLLTARPTLATLRLTPRLGRSLVQQLVALVASNKKAAMGKTKKKGRKGGGKGKAKAASRG